jgi:hypothetical protein
VRNSSVVVGSSNSNPAMVFAIRRRKLARSLLYPSSSKRSASFLFPLRRRFSVSFRRRMYRSSVVSRQAALARRLDRQPDRVSSAAADGSHLPSPTSFSNIW